jgi:hypothetical protein
MFRHPFRPGYLDFSAFGVLRSLLPQTGEPHSVRLKARRIPFFRAMSRYSNTQTTALQPGVWWIHSRQRRFIRIASNSVPWRRLRDRVRANAEGIGLVFATTGLKIYPIFHCPSHAKKEARFPWV